MNIIQEIKDEIRAARREPSSRDLTVTALVFLIILSSIGAYTLFWSGKWYGAIWIAVGHSMLLARLIPPLFRRIYRLWIAFSVVLGYFVSRILLTIIFCVIVVPTGLIMRLVGKDPMDRKLDPAAQSYWNKKEQETDTTIERYERQF